MKVWDTNEARVVEVFDGFEVVYCHAMSRAATAHALVAVASKDREIMLLDLRSGSRTHTLVGHRKSVMTLAWSPLQEFLLASGSKDNKVREEKILLCVRVFVKMCMCMRVCVFVCACVCV